MLTLEQFKNARNVLQGVLRPTHLIDSPYLSRLCGNNVYLKPENMQVTGAYKIRGAYFKISTLTPEEKERGLVTASAGNHAQGVAYAAQAAGVPATIVMPTTTPPTLTSSIPTPPAPTVCSKRPLRCGIWPPTPIPMPVSRPCRRSRRPRRRRRTFPFMP